MTTDGWLERLPPFMVRLLARHRESCRRSPMTNEQIAKAAGKPKRWVTVISKMDSWDRVRWGDVRLFLSACGIEMEHLFREWEYVRRSMGGGTSNMLAHLDHLPPKDKEFTDSLMISKRNQIANLIKTHILK